MKDFNFKRFILAVLAVFVVFEILNYLIHGPILMSTYEAIEDVWRADMEEKMWIMHVTAFIFSIFFVCLFHFFFKGHFKKGWKKGLCYGLLIGFLMVGLINQHAIYDVSLSLALQWFIYGVVQLAICGIVLSLIYKPKEVAE